MNWTDIVFWIVLVFLFLFFLFLLRRENPTGVTARSIALDAMFIAIIVLMGFVPQLGYISIIPGLSLTLLHLPVLLGAAIMGPKKGLLYGLAFGLTSWAQALMNPIGLNALFIYPWISVLPRLVFGLLAGFSFKILAKAPKILRGGIGEVLTSFLLTLVHTGLVFLFLFIFNSSEVLAFFTSDEVLVSALGLTFLGVILLGALGEALVAAIIVPLLSRALRKVTNLKRRRA